MFICWLPFVPFWYIKLRRLGNTEKYDAKTRYDYVRMICKRAIQVSRVKVIYSGLENLPKENGYVIFPNHQGLFDSLLFIYTHEEPLSVVTRTDMRNVRLLRRVFDALGALAIDREDVRQSMKIIIQMAEDVSKGTNYLIFPEGTRSRNGNNLLPFKGGSFKASTKTKTPIVPAAIIDSYKPFDSNSIKKCTVQVHYLKPLYYEDYKDMKTTEIADLVHDMIQEKINSELGITQSN